MVGFSPLSCVFTTRQMANSTSLKRKASASIFRDHRAVEITSLSVLPRDAGIGGRVSLSIERNRRCAVLQGLEGRAVSFVPRHLPQDLPCPYVHVASRQAALPVCAEDSADWQKHFSFLPVVGRLGPVWFRITTTTHDSREKNLQYIE